LIRGLGVEASPVCPSRSTRPIGADAGQARPGRPARAVAAKLRDPEVQVKLLGSDTAGAEPAATVIASVVRLAELLEAPASPAGRDALRRLIAGVALGETELRAEVSFAKVDGADGGGLTDLAALELPVFSVAARLRLRRRGPELRTVLGGAAAPAPTPDPLLVRTLVEARRRLAA
jgi:hypothetical protein